ncbi:MAG: hypothetical protein WA210_08360, partial [Burkholderiaceae bacterium]
MREASISIAIGCALWSLAASALAFGFGRASSPTALGQNLSFTTVVRVEPNEDLVAECVAAEVLSGDYRLAPQALRVSIEPSANAGERLLRIASNVAIDEPVVTLTLTLGCVNRISRKFVVFIDPPSVNLAQSSIVESSPAEPPRAEPAVPAPIPLAVLGAPTGLTSAPPGSAAAAPAPRRP